MKSRRRYAMRPASPKPYGSSKNYSLREALDLLLGQQDLEQVRSRRRIRGHETVRRRRSATLPATNIVRLTKEEIATPKMSMECFLIAHPKGNLMWDVGAIPDNSFPPGGPGTGLKLYYLTPRDREAYARLLDGHGIAYSDLDGSIRIDAPVTAAVMQVLSHLVG